jgi:hypothetical protein
MSNWTADWSNENTIIMCAYSIFLIIVWILALAERRRMGPSMTRAPYPASPRPYRELALVPASPTEPAALWPWFPTGGTEPCPKCRTAKVNSQGKPMEVPAHQRVLSVSVLCTGRTRFWPFRRACLETREHFHVRCRVCGWTTLMATADAT